MFLKEVEDALDLDVNVITKKVEKHKLCELNYDTYLGGLIIENRKELVDTKKGEKEITYHYLYTETGVYFDENDYTTTKFVKLYNNLNPKLTIPIRNDPLIVECDGKKIRIGYINIIYYLHLPDYIMTEILRGGGKVTAVRSGQIIEFKKGNVVVYKHSESIPSPYYFFESKFSYYENADILAEIIGAFDVYKRGYIKDKTLIDEDKALKYFLYPYVSMILYKQTHTTLYPSLIDSIVSIVEDRVKETALEKLKKYLSSPLEEIKKTIEKYNNTEQPILEVFKEW